MEDDVTGKFHDWAKHEMKLENVPAKEDLKRLCHGPMVGVCKYMYKNLHSKETAEKVQGNLRLYRATRGAKTNISSEKKQELLKRKQILLEKLKEKKQEVALLAKDIKHHETSIAETEVACKEFKHQLHQIEEKRALLKVKKHQVVKQTSDIEACRKSLQQAVQHFREKEQVTSNPVYYSSTGSSEKLETQCQRDVRKACGATAAFLTRFANKEYVDNPEAKKTAQVSVSKSLQQVVDHYASEQIVSSLCTVTDNSDTKLLQLAHDVDLQRDMNKLQYKMTNEQELKDVSDKRVTQKAVSHMVQTKNIEHMQCYMNTETHKKNAAKLKAKQKQLTRQLHQSLKHKGQDSELVRKLVDAELQCSVVEGLIKSGSEIVTELRERKEKAQQQHMDIQDKHRQITEFTTIVSNKEDLIQVLTKLNADKQQQIMKLQSQIASYSQGVHNSTPASQCHPLMQSLHNSLNKEVKMFTKVDTDLIRCVDIDNSGVQIPRSDLSLHNAARHYSDIWAQIARILDVPACMSSSYMLRRVVDLLRKVNFYHKLTNQHPHSDDTQQLTHLQGTHQSVQAYNKSESERLCPVLESDIRAVTQAITHVLQVKDSIYVWFDQPAQFEVPWYVVDGENLESWVNRFKVLTTQIRQTKASLH